VEKENDSRDADFLECEEKGVMEIVLDEKLVGEEELPSIRDDVKNKATKRPRKVELEGERELPITISDGEEGEAEADARVLESDAISNEKPEKNWKRSKRLQKKIPLDSMSWMKLWPKTHSDQSL